MDNTLAPPILERSAAGPSPWLRALVQGPRWLLVAALVFAPWAYGATRDWARQALSVMLATVVVLWLAGCVLRRRRPEVPMVALIAVIALLLQGAWMALNPQSSFDIGTMLLLPIPALAPGLPGTVDGARSREAMILFAGLLGAFLFCCDLMRRPVWRKRLWITLVAVSASIAVFGIIQKIGGLAAQAWIWEPDRRDPNSNFATFRYRGNAGAFLNLALPLAAGLVFLAFRKREGAAPKFFWVSALFLILLGAQFNSSRATWAIALLLVGAFVVRAGWHVWRGHDGEWRPRLLLVQGSAAALLLAGIVGVSMLGRWETSWSRLAALGVHPSWRSPTEIYLRMAPDAGWLGFGPGTFEAVFPRYQRLHDFGGRSVPEFWVSHFWSHAHQDYLQAVIEWGWLGAACWAVLLFGGVGRGVMRCVHEPAGSATHWLLFCSLLALGGVLLHSLIDFPLQIASIQLYVCVLLAVCWSAKPVSARAA